MAVLYVPKNIRANGVLGVRESRVKIKELCEGAKVSGRDLIEVTEVIHTESSDGPILHPMFIKASLIQGIEGE